MTTVLCLRIFETTASTSDVLNFTCALLKLFCHQRVKNSDNGKRQEIVNCGFDNGHVSDQEEEREALQLRSRVLWNLFNSLAHIGELVIAVRRAVFDLAHCDDFRHDESWEGEENRHRPSNSDYNEHHP